ncbi:GDSL esterase/lipase At4g01130-like [Abrus precatorius]|uniref:GDSL esterase/lipase At4g01130-like n=1 Tax=Abrus precatorius TaxID=3816 RepID=A0A8B8JZY3_ABRPR|nr:GDSL esterase/lipase At4g01130-like [Abrus precatorius]XP_027336942.1 GDSL esterase/lipase At4g01130-like [Abrus precatorius]
MGRPLLPLTTLAFVSNRSRVKEKKMSTLKFFNKLNIFSKFLVICMMVSLLVGSSYSACDFKAIFNFGDSNSDTGGFHAAFPAQPRPYGMTYFKKPAGRASDGRLIVDFLAQALGLPYLSPYLQSIGSDYTNGANFASSASTVLQPTTSFFVSGLSPFSLAIQLRQMEQFKAQVDESHQKGTMISSDGSSGTKIPSPDIFGKAIYTFYIGQNDFTSKIAATGSIDGVRHNLPQIVLQIDAAIKELYVQGGRTFMVFNLGPVGCYPGYLVELPHANSDFDEFGCMISYNNAVHDYNKLLKETLSQTRKSLIDASLVYVDTNSALLELFHHPTYYGLKYGSRACCGHGGGDYNFDPKILCGNMVASACDDPENYVSWDGIHFTEAANKLVAMAIINGSLFDPPFPLHEHCDLQPIID